MPEEGKGIPGQAPEEGKPASPTPPRDEKLRQPGIIFSASGSKISSQELLDRMNGKQKNS